MFTWLSYREFRGQTPDIRHAQVLMTDKNFDIHWDQRYIKSGSSRLEIKWTSIWLWKIWFSQCVIVKPFADLDCGILLLLSLNALNSNILLMLENSSSDPSLGWHKHRLQLQRFWKTNSRSEHKFKISDFYEIQNLNQKLFRWNANWKTVLDIRNTFCHRKKY